MGGKRKFNLIDQLVRNSLDLRLTPSPQIIEEPEMKLRQEVSVDGL